MTLRRPRDLPNFSRPPLNELVLSVQFGSLPFKNHHAGILWERFSQIYPNVEEQPPIDPVFETFGTQVRAERLSLQLMPMETLRYWFVTQDGNELLQIQRDRLIHNWRQQNSDDQYPRYEPLRQKFEQEIATAASFFRDQGIGEITCNQCEVSYINVIPLVGEANATLQLADIFTIWTDKYSDQFLGQIERGQFSLSYVLPDESSKEPLGRLHIAAQPAVLRSENKPAVRLSVTARGKPMDDTVTSALAWLDRGREAAVRGFTSITTKKMHRLWGRKGQR
jgi:uncharacterized protein (TIGR04255 family)